MVIKIYFRKNVKVSRQKLAAACTHIGNHLGQKYLSQDAVEGPSDPVEDVVVILSASDKKFDEIKENVMSQNGLSYHLHVDNGFTEVEPGTEMAIGWIVEEDEYA